jgi:hypothetical protein
VGLNNQKHDCGSTKTPFRTGEGEQVSSLKAIIFEEKMTRARVILFFK